MAAMSRGRQGRVFKVSKPKKSTPSSRRHHFESFSERIAKLKIDPIRRERRYLDDDTSSQASYFKTSFDEWRDLNLSEDFTSFSRDIQSLCESLPQILHYEDRIMDLLVAYIEKHNALSLEPLLNLVAQFAHDLGARFEKHFSRAVMVVSRVAASHPDVEVIEWSFTCLAWLFKYLSKLLVQDLRPLYDLISPLLGGEQQKPFVVRFAAESLSFLIRKAGMIYHRDDKPLKLIIRHIISDLDSEPTKKNQISLYQDGVSALFYESMRGVQRGLHSSADVVFQTILDSVLDPTLVEPTKDQMSPVLRMADSVLIALIHHTDVSTFEPLFDVVIKQVREWRESLKVSHIEYATRLLFVIVGVRQGTRIQKWDQVLDSIASLVIWIDDIGANFSSRATSGALYTLALCLQTSPLDALLPHVRLLDRVTTGLWKQHFLDFTYFFAELGASRFQSLLLPQFQRFLGAHWEIEADKLCVLLPKLAEIVPTLPSLIKIPSDWKDSMTTSFEEMTRCVEQNGIVDEKLVAKCSGYLEVFTVTSTENNQQKEAQLFSRLFRTAIDVDAETSPKSWVMLAIGSGFKFLMNTDPGCISSSEIWIALCQKAATCQGLPIFWEAVLEYIKQNSESLELKGDHMDLLVSSLSESLRSPSHDIRTHCLDILGAIYKKLKGDIPDMLSTAITIESMPLTLETARAISMNVRGLGMGFKDVVADEWLTKAIPSFCFGLLYVRLAQAWDDSTQTLKEICNEKEGEEVVLSIALEWLHGYNSSASVSDASELQPESETRGPVGSFECTNLNKLEKKVQDSQSVMDDTASHLSGYFQSKHRAVPAFTENSRAQALRVLNAIPQLAEKRSRIIVPTFLQWSSQEETNRDDDNLEEDAVSLSNQRWNRKDQKSMLSLFAQFINPRVLFKSQDVYSALLSLLANGDPEIQKSALKAIFAWKDHRINRYEENLVNTLDDARFREQVSVFLDIGQEESTVQEDDRDALMPVLLRILYGKVIARAGSASGRRGQEVKRKAVFIALTRFEEKDVRHFLSIALGPLDNMTLIKDAALDENLFAKDVLSTRKQHGLLNLLEDFMDTLRSDLQPFATPLIEPLLYCLIQAVRGITTLGSSEQSSELQLSLLRNIRQLGYHCLNSLFSACPELDWAPYMPIIFGELIQPRLEKLPIETAQSVSAVLRLFSIWGSSIHTAHFLCDYDDRVVATTAQCLDVASAKDEVKLFVLREILLKLISTATDAEVAEQTLLSAKKVHIQERILKPNAELFLTRIGDLLQKSPSKDMLEAGVQSITSLAPFVGGFLGSKTLINLAIFLLEQPSRRVGFHVKTGLVQILHQFVPRCDLQDDHTLFQSILRVTSSLFAFFQDRAGRIILCQIMQDIAEQDPTLKEVAGLCEDLNSFSTSRLDEPDFDRRNKAFAVINEKKYLQLSATQWQPIVQNTLFFVKDNEELGIRVSASFALRRFAEAASDSNSANAEECTQLLGSTVIPAVNRGVQESSELVRMEFVSVMGHIVKLFPDWSKVQDMHVLLVGEDEEASFFTNVLHIQQHRRSRALKRLATEAVGLSSENTSRFLIPLIEHYVLDMADDEQARNLASETIKTISSLCRALEWSQYRALLRRYSDLLLKRAEGMEKTMVKLLVGVVDALSDKSKSPEPENNHGDDENSGEIKAVNRVGSPIHTLHKTLPSKKKIAEDLNTHLIPALMGYIHQKDESTVSLRVPVAEVVVKLLRIFPQEEFEARLPAVLMDISHILRSRAPESRDMTRKTLAEIMALIGPAYFGFALKELRTALQRGYQLHVLSYTVHSLIVSMSPTLKLGDLDYALDPIATVVMDDIFGITGQEKDAEEYTSKMKEIKTSKSYDTMELVAKTANLRNLSTLLSPVRALLQEKLTLKLVKKIDELLRRIGLGVLHNPSVNGTDILFFCHEIVREVYKATQKAPSEDKVDDYKTRRYLVNMKGADKTANRGTTTSYIHKLKRFAFDVLRAVLNKYDNLQTPSNLAGWMKPIGDAVVDGQEEVQTSAMRLVATIIKVPLPEIDRHAPVYIDQAVRLIENAASTSTEQVQAALKMISSILRERKGIEVKEKHIAKLLKRLKPDLEEPERQGVTFNFLKAVMARKIMVPELYELIDTVATIMVTNHSRTTRDLARGAYVQFMIDYPQSKKRFQQQRDFLKSNLTYKYVEGRQSVLESINLLLNKLNDELTQEIAVVVFLPLMQVMVADDATECREMAATLLKKLFEFASKDTMKTFLNVLQAYLDQDENTSIKHAALQCWRLYIESQDISSTDTAFILDRIETILSESSEKMDPENWQLPFDSLKLYTKFFQRSPEVAVTADKKTLWSSVINCLYFPHIWVKHAAAGLIELCLTDIAKTNSTNGLSIVPLLSSGGLELSRDDMIKLTRAHLRILRVPNIPEDLCVQIVKNLLFLGRCFSANGLVWGSSPAEEAEEFNGLDEEDNDELEDEEEEEEEEEDSDRGAKTALEHLFRQAAAILRREPATTRAASLYPKAAALQLLAALSNKVSTDSLESYLEIILQPLFILVSPSKTIPHSTDTDFVTGYQELKTSAQDLMNMLQKKLGTTTYVKSLELVRKRVVERREGRRIKRRIEAVAQPEKALLKKKLKREGEKVKRKERNMEMRARRRGH